MRSSRHSWPTVARNANVPDRIGTYPLYFDDRKTIVVSSSIVNFPTSLPRFYGDGESGIVDRQDLFTGDVEVTGSTVTGLADQFVGRGFTEYVKPFNENKRYENTPASTTDSFYTTGSGIDLFGSGLEQPLKTKTHVNVVLPVNNKVKMLELSSCMYYYNSDDGAWEIPLNSSYVTADDGTIPDDTWSGDIADPSMYAVLNSTIEDGRGFGPIGNALASGSNFVPGVATDVYINSPFNDLDPYTQLPVTFTEVLSKTYEKTVQVNRDYEALPSETFVLPISQPFLIEKAVIELPIAAGDGWFKNMTTSFFPITWTVFGDDARSLAFDFAGPGLTVALYNQIKVGNKTRRDLIMTGTITHALDNVAQVRFSKDPPFTDVWQARAVGFRSYANPGAVITPNLMPEGYCFTGSVAVPCEAAVSNGLTLRWLMFGDSEEGGGVPFTPETLRQMFRNAFASPTIDISNAHRDLTLGSSGQEFAYISYIDPFGRSASGFNASGRSVLGQEFVSLPTSKMIAGRMPNPLYIPGSNAKKTGADSGLPEQIEAAIGTGSDPIAAVFSTAAFLGGSKRSPYLVRPGDKLVLSISKTRPFFYGTETGGSTVSGSFSDDVTLNTGSVNITLYGCTLQENQELNDTLNQPLTSDAIHEMIGAEPVIDQFDVSFRDEYVGGMFDDYITGSFVDRVTGPNGRMMLRTNNSPRGRVFSGFNASNTPMTEYDDIAFDPPTLTGNQENVTNPSKNFRLQPWFERVGTPRVLKMTSPSERMWDSMMPSFMDCMNVDSSGITLMSEETNPLDPGRRRSGNTSKAEQQFGFIFFNLKVFGGAINPTINTDWANGFPFEPRYSKVARLVDVSMSFLANYMTTVSGINQIDPVLVSELFVGTTAIGGLTNPEAPNLTIMADANLSFKNGNADFIYFNTGSLGLNDQLRMLYGFGDRRRPNFAAIDLDRTAPDHLPDYRDSGEYSEFTIIGDVLFTFGIVIRGWKYGVMNGLPMFNSGYWRQGHYGQFRDMLEQRPFTKFYNVPDASVSGLSSIAGQTTSVVTVQFIDPSTGKITPSENTWSQNLSFECTSSLPYFDGDIRNRSPYEFQII